MRSESHALRRILLAVLATVLFHGSVSAQAVLDPFGGVPQAHILLVGTFHFDDPGLDDYKPQFPWNPLEPGHQQEIAEVVRLLAAFRPTRIALEWPIARQAALDSAYRAFVSGQNPPSANEREQLGFRLARELGHERVYAIDAPARAYDPDMTQQAYDQHVSRLLEGADMGLMARQQELTQRYEALARFHDSLKGTIPLREYLLHANEPGRVLASHGQYLTGSFYLGRGDDYLGPDMRTRWYNRNLRIVHNIQRITSSPEERILLIIGSGHLPILRHALEASPEYLLVEVSRYLAAQRGGVDSAMPPGVLEAAEALVVHAPSVDRVWPGFWDRPRPYVILDFESRDRALLVTSGEPLDRYAPVPDSGLPPALRGKVYVRDGEFDSGFLTAAGPVPDERTPTPVPLVAPILRGYTQTALILHETFHLWQRARWNDHHRRPPLDCTPQRYEGVVAQLPPGFDAATTRELRQLSKAVAGPEDERTEAIRSFLSVRLERLLTADPQFLAVDQRQERVEGTAEFTGLAGSLAILYPDTFVAGQALQDSLVVRLGNFDRHADEMQLDPSRRAAMRAYYGGAAMAFLLDRLGVEGWRNDIEEGDFLDMVLARYLGDTAYLFRVEEYGRPRRC